MQDVTQRVSRQRPDDYMDMIGHHHPCAQLVALLVEMSQRIGDEIGDVWFAQPTRAVSGIQQRLDLVAIPREQLLFFVPCQRTLGRPGLFQDDFALVLQSGDFVIGQ